MSDRDAGREVLDVDVLIVGAGPAGLATAYRLKSALSEAGRDDISIAVVEKAKDVGAHSISGAVMDPSGLDALMPDWRSRGAPIEHRVVSDDVAFLTRGRSFSLPLVPPPLRNEGNLIVSLNRLVRWMAGVVEGLGVDVLPGFAGSEPLFDGDRLAGVRIGDKGVDRAGRPKANFEPGIDIAARYTVLADGVRGSVTERVVERFGLAEGRNPQVYAIGVKELWHVDPGRHPPGQVLHTLGFPLSGSEFGGGFVYTMADGLVSVGLVIGLDYRDPRLDPHARFQAFKQHPRIRSFIDGGELRGYGAKAIPEGGYWAMPRPWFAGGLIVGDSGGFLNAMRLKGIHLAIHSGILAADTVAEAIVAEDKGNGAGTLSGYGDRIASGSIRDELWAVRNFHQGFENGLWSGLAHAGLQMVTGGRGLRNRYPNRAGHERMGPVSAVPDRTMPVAPGPLAVDKLTDVYHSGTAHDEDQPVHLVVLQPDLCHTRCTREFGNPCQHFCPAAVYAMTGGTETNPRLEIQASNCVHCKTCDIMDPYQIIRWECPEGGGGPGYDRM